MLFNNRGNSTPDSGLAGPHGSDNFSDDPYLQDENLLQDNISRATGLVGGNSEVQWLRNLKFQMESEISARISTLHIFHDQQEPFKPASTSRACEYSFYLDSDDFDTDAMVNPYALPPPEIAEKLLDCYMSTVHSSFPILPDMFAYQFRSYFDNIKRNRRYHVPGHWQAILNLVLAIGAKNSRSVQANWPGNDGDHIIYVRRATRILGLDKITLSLHAPSLSIIQVHHLVLYLDTISRI